MTGAPDDDKDTWVDHALKAILLAAVLALAVSRAGCTPLASLSAALDSLSTSFARLAQSTRRAGEFAARPGASAAELAALESFRAPFEQARDLRAAKRPAEALPLIDQALKADPQLLPRDARGAGLVLRALILVDLNRTDEALLVISEARLLIAASQAAEVRAAAAFKKGDYREVAASLRDFLDAGGRPTPTHYVALGQAYDQLGDPQQAATWAHRGHVEFPADADLARLDAKYTRDIANERGMTTRYSDKFSVKLLDLPGRSAAQEKALEVLDRAYGAVCSTYGFVPTEILPVVLYPTSGAYFSSSGAPQWSGAQFDGKVRIPLPADNTAGLEPVVAHETTHYVVHRIAGNHVPAWLDEGLAQVAERRDEGWARREIQRAGRTPSLSELDAPFTRFADPDQARLAYATALVKTHRLVDQLGMQRMKQLLQALGTGRSADDVLQEFVGLDGAGITH